MAKNGLIAALAALLLASWIWPRFGHFSNEAAAPPASPGPTPSPPPPDPLAPLNESMAAMQAAPGFEAAAIGFCVLGDQRDAPVFAYQAEQAMTPASTLKAVTSAAALEILGPEFRFETVLGTSTAFAIDEEGAYDGDLMVQGGGDPFFAYKSLSIWASELKKRGLRKVSGNLIGDGRCFPEALIPDAWDWGDVSNYYGAGPSGLNLERNRFTVSFEPASELGQPAAHLTLSPPLEWLEQHNFTTTTTEGSRAWTSIYGGPFADTLTFRGNIPQESGIVTARGAIPDPTYHTVHEFARYLKAAGIEIAGSLTTMRRLQSSGDLPLPDMGKELLRHESEPLLEIVLDLNHTSDNLVTECVFQQLRRADAFGRSGQDLIAAHWEERGIEMKGLRMEDGSGLARADAIRPLDLARVLWITRRGPQGDAFFHTLPLNHGGAIRWKGGAMSKVRAYTGYTRNGYTFALMINHYTADSQTLAEWRTRLLDHVLDLPRVVSDAPGS